MNNNLSLIKIINGLSKTINIANKMLPLYNQIKPIIINSSKALNNININTNTKTNKVTNDTLKKEVNNNLPTFFQ